jgi:hypothetical protein
VPIKVREMLVNNWIIFGVKKIHLKEKNLIIVPNPSLPDELDKEAAVIKRLKIQDWLTICDPIWSAVAYAFQFAFRKYGKMIEPNAIVRIIRY